MVNHQEKSPFGRRYVVSSHWTSKSMIVGWSWLCFGSKVLLIVIPLYLYIWSSNMDYQPTKTTCFCFQKGSDITCSNYGSYIFYKKKHYLLNEDLAILCDLLRMVNRLFQRLCDLQPGDKKVTLNRLGGVFYQKHLSEGKWRYLGMVPLIINPIYWVFIGSQSPSRGWFSIARGPHLKGFPCDSPPQVWPKVVP